MHPNPAFRKAEHDLNLDFARQRSFGTLALNADDGPLLSHIPFFIDPASEYLEAHLVRSNPILRLLDRPQHAVISVTGPDSYISPDWYEVENQVPTWNYIAVHIRGQLEKLPTDRLPDFLERLSGQFEQRLAPKPVWTMDKVSAEALEKLLKMIVPITMKISSIDGTWKLAQNKPDAARIGAALKVSENGIGMETGNLSQLMKNPPC